MLYVPPGMSMAGLTKRVGTQNVSNTLAVNGLPRVPNIGQAFVDIQKEVVRKSPTIANQKKLNILKHVTDNSDVFEAIALTTETGWKLAASMGYLPGYIKIPESVTIQDGSDVLGNGEPVSEAVYQGVVTCLSNEPYIVDPSIFNTYTVDVPHTIQRGPTRDLWQWFPIPWGEVTLYSSISDDYVDFPVYPNEISDGVKANYNTMPDLIYQYEPWQLYTGSGPRSQTFTFHFHRDMWTGDHRDGMANKLIRFCEACCYPDYRGSAVATATVGLYIAGKLLISGILTDVNVTWSGPLGLDKWYLDCELQITIVEVSTTLLNYNVVRNKPLIG